MSSWGDADAAVAWGSVAMAGVSLAQSWYHRKRELEREQKEHDEEMDALLENHKNEVLNAKRTYVLNIFTDMERHFQQLNADLLSNNKESERDMYDQRNQQSQTFILAATIMLLALVCVLIQGVLPTNNDDPASATTNKILYLVYSISNAGALSALFICIVLYFEIVRQASKFMYKRTKGLRQKIHLSMKHTTALIEENQQSRMRSYSKESLSQTTLSLSLENPSTAGAGDGSVGINILDGAMAGGGGGVYMGVNRTESTRKKGRLPNWFRPPPLRPSASFLTQSSSSTSTRGSRESETHSIRPPPSPGGGMWTSAFKRSLTYDLNNTDETKLDEEWEEHEKRTRVYLDKRNKLHDEIAEEYSEQSFKNFWEKSCKNLSFFGERFFSIGTSLCLIAMATFMWATFTITYSSLTGALVAVVPIGISLVLGYVFIYCFELPYIPEEPARQQKPRSMRAASSSTARS